MPILNDIKEEIKDRVLDAISQSIKGMSLREICSQVYDEKDSEEYVQINRTHICLALDELLQEGYVSFDLEQDLWECID
jgi:hypothetical protein